MRAPSPRFLNPPLLLGDAQRRWKGRSVDRLMTHPRRLHRHALLRTQIGDDNLRCLGSREGHA